MVKSDKKLFVFLRKHPRMQYQALLPFDKFILHKRMNVVKKEYTYITLWKEDRTSELQSPEEGHLVCRLLLEKKNCEQ